MSLHGITHWVQTETGRKALILSIEDIFHTWSYERVLWIVKEKDIDEARGLCFIYGKAMNIHVIGNANQVCFEPHLKYGFYIYPYNPRDIGMVPTRYVAKEITL